MKLATFSHSNQTRVGAVVGQEIVDSTGLIDGLTTMVDFINLGERAIAAMDQRIAQGSSRLDLYAVKLEAPVLQPTKYLAISLNYADHISETGLEKPEFPSFFNKQTSCIIADGEPIHRPKVSEKVDYEGELALVIGKRCRHVPIDRAKDVIYGYTIANDVSVRDWQFRSPTFTLGKSFDTHGPLGPWLVTADEVGDPHRLDLKTWVGGELRQSSNTAHMIFNCYEMISYLSTVMTLEPGDIIATGTPSGVGVKMKPRGYMLPGQEVRIEIEKLGALTNPVISEPDSTVQY